MVGKNQDTKDLPAVVSDYIAAVMKKMGYRRKVRQEVKEELVAHFVDALKDCENEKDREERGKELIAEFGDVKLLGVLLRRGKKRCRAKWRTAVVRMFQGIGILLLGLILYCLYISFAQPTIRVDYVAEMTRVNRPVADENLNAAVLYQKAIDNYVEQPKIEHEVKLLLDPLKYVLEEVPFDNQQTQIKEVGLLTAIRDKQWIGDLTEEEVSLLRQWVADNAEAIDYFRAGSERPHCWWKYKTENGRMAGTGWPMMNAFLPEQGLMWDMVGLICWRAKLKASEGKIEEGLDDLLKCYKTGEHFKGPRTLIQQLGGIGMQGFAVNSSRVILNHAEVDTGTLKAFQEQLEDMEATGTYVSNFETERFFFSDLIQRSYTDNGRGGGRMIPKGGMLLIEEVSWGDPAGPVERYATSLGLSLVCPNRREITAEVEKVFQTAEKWAKMTPWQLRKSGEEESMEFEKWSMIKRIRYWPLLFIPALSKVSVTSYRNRAELEALIATIAILRHEKEKGEYPEALAKLVEAGYLREIPMDPYSDKSLGYKRTDDGFILYSFGVNFADDGGTRYGSTWGGSEGDRIFWPVETYQQQEERRERENEQERAERKEGRKFKRVSK
jgi:hypothetical protein